ncbi:hypothetical protein [Roseibium sp. RKSG952]|uniref:hypothetical protein n=1 Tax=Roseibium sp. RKSG952 TaxID=2529384 RepID=UPI0012BD8297|nr:hypothetical protein [Roseibium sp. RKSG952]MTH95494.1 hypothetical protein [Roseibium sp. RKSG952]
MGVGVYTNDFNGSGGTFMVSAALPSDDDYRSYVIDLGRDYADSFDAWKESVAETPDPSESDYEDYLFELGEDDALSIEAWRQDQVDTEVENMEYLIAEACKKLSMSVNAGGRCSRADFDDEFVLVGDGRHVQVGWRNWEHDYVIGIGGTSKTKYWGGEPDAYAGEIMEETGLAPSAYCNTYADLASKVSDYVRLSLMVDGFECRFRTSGYTTDLYEAPAEGFEAALSALETQIASLNDCLSTDFEDGLTEATDIERVEIAKEILSCDHNTVLRAAVPVYDPVQGKLNLYAPTESKIFAAVPMNDILRAEIADIISDLPNEEDYVSIPRNENTLKVFGDLQAKAMDHVVISVDEWNAAEPGDLQIDWVDDNGNHWVAGIVMGDKQALPTP